MIAGLFAGGIWLLTSIASVLGEQTPTTKGDNLTYHFAENDETLALNVSKCPGYNLIGMRESMSGFTATLDLAGPSCNAFGKDVTSLTLEVTYETDSRLHVNIFDNDKSQFIIPSSVISFPPAPTVSHEKTSDLAFNYEASPFAFWITRRSEPKAEPLFDTRISSLPPTPLPPVIPQDNSTALDGFPLVFEDQYLQLTSALPVGANIYGLGEIVASSGFRRDVGDHGAGTIQTMWARDAADPIDENIYGSHPIYLEHRYDELDNSAKSHGVFLFSASGSDILLLTPPGSSKSLIQYRQIGGTLDFYFFSGPSPQQVVEQYGELIGLPTWQPAFGFGFHLCRWGYPNVSETRDVVNRMREAQVPLEVMWNDIDLYHAVRDFTTDPISFPIDEVSAFIKDLHSNDQHFIPILDAAIAKQVNSTDFYDPYIRGAELDVFIKNPDGTEYVGQVWPGYTVFPDWFSENTQQYWTEAITNWSRSGVDFSGIWLDMNEAASFCDGSCGTGANISDTSLPFPLPGDPDDLVTDYPEGYDSSRWGPSGNYTINGTLTYGVDDQSITKRGTGAGDQDGVDLNEPPYAIHNGNGRLSLRTLATNATHKGGYAELDVHNLWGLMEEKATHLALNSLHPGKRPFLISRSTFPSAGKWTGHWLGDNFSKWQYMYFNIQGTLQFQLFQIPFVGADTCGFNGNTDEELCNRWMQLSAFMPFYRNHNERGALSQEPFRWDSVADAARKAIQVRYSLLPYWYTLFANASMFGSSPVRPLFFEFPKEKELFGVDQQYLIGRDILVTPVLTPNASTVDGIFPGRGTVIWRDWYTQDVVDANSGGNTTLPAPLGHINVHIRDGSAILLHSKPAYTIAETRRGPYSLLISLSTSHEAAGTAYVDDGESIPPTPNKTLSFRASQRGASILSQGSFHIEQKLDSVTVLGITKKPGKVEVQGKPITNFGYDGVKGQLLIKNLNVDLNGQVSMQWL